MSSWGFVLYSAFCVTTARPLAGTPAAQTAQSEQRQDTGVTAGLLRADWGRALLVVAGLLVVAAPYGSWLLALLAAGLFSYGLYCLAEARYRDLTPGQ